MTGGHLLLLFMVASAVGSFVAGYALGVATAARSIDRHSSDWSDR